MSEALRLAILISGNGSNLQAIIDAIEDGRLDAEILLVVSNDPDAYGLARASGHGLATRTVEDPGGGNRELLDQALRDCLEPLNPDYILLAGFMRILGAKFIDAFPDRILNIHPSLLPAYKGLDTHQRALDNGESEHGVSIHLVTAELDGGPVILQGAYPIETGDTAEDLRQKGHRLEHRMYPQVLTWLADGTLEIKNGQIYYEQLPLDNPVSYPS
ncbi:MAG TPA: phosphoribosylglycinamide formyltransferase [Gammaproteobacteria bacterium]|nr:phosphoribosylglycinamide formyltransferase [Gammaproteobacteria bacterium]